GWKIIQRQADRIDLVSLKEVRFLCVIYNMAADAAPAGELSVHLGSGGSHGAFEGRRSTNLDLYGLFFTPRQAPRTVATQLRRGGGGARIAEFAQVVFLERANRIERLAMRELAVRGRLIEGELVTHGAAALHGNGLEVLPGRHQFVAVGAPHRSAVAQAGDPLRIEMLRVRELEVGLFLGLVHVLDFEFPVDAQ